MSGQTAAKTSLSTEVQQEPDERLPEKWYEHRVIRAETGRSCMINGVEFLDARAPHELYACRDGDPKGHEFLLISRECKLRGAIDQMVEGYEQGAMFLAGVEQLGTPPAPDELKGLLVEATKCLSISDPNWRNGFVLGAGEKQLGDENLAELAESLQRDLLAREVP